MFVSIFDFEKFAATFVRPFSVSFLQVVRVCSYTGRQYKDTESSDKSYPRSEISLRTSSKHSTSALNQNDKTVIILKKGKKCERCVHLEPKWLRHIIHVVYISRWRKWWCMDPSTLRGSSDGRKVVSDAKKISHPRRNEYLFYGHRQICRLLDLLSFSTILWQ